MHRLGALVLCLALMVAVVPGRAQPVEGAPPPYDTDLRRLAEILGALHWLRGLCGANEGNVWRQEMQDLLDAEAPSGERREQMIASFNRGYFGFRDQHRTCTPASQVVIGRYLEEGARLARGVTSRFGN